MSTRQQRGVTLIELIVALTIVAIAVAGMMAAFTRATAASADPMITKQMAAVAETLMEEIQLKPFAPAAQSGSSRTDYNDVLDYNGYHTTGVVDISGNPVSGLEEYNVIVAVATVALTGIGSDDACRIVVTVTHGSDTFTLYGWRTRA